ncbi:MAG TPA: ABC transporter permease [Solirubrobacterales bacterium]|jgi:ABC-2 type transport system permease protein|nr:ABC transporter permease [Solirubrobacterales bacterium]
MAPELSAPARPSFWSTALIVAWRNIHNFYTNPALAVPALLFPLFFFTAFAGGLSNVQNVPGFDYPNGYTAFQFAFVLMQASAFGGVFTGFGIARDFETGFGRRLMLATPRRTAILVGYALSAMARAVTIGALLFAIAMLTGMKVTGSFTDLIGLITLALLVNITATMWAAGIAFRFRSIQAGPLMQVPVFMILFLAPVYVPYDLLAGWIKTAARINPITAVIEGARNLLAASTEEVALAFGGIIAVGLVLTFWAISGLRRAEAAGS